MRAASSPRDHRCELGAETSPTPDDVAAAFADCFRRFAEALDGGFARELGPGALAIVTGVPVATMNGVWATDAAADPNALAGGLDAVGGLGLPFCLQVRPAGEAACAPAAVARGMTPAPPIPMMARAGPVVCDTPGELSIRRLSPGEALTHATVAAPAFAAPVELFATAVTEATLRAPGVRGYVGEVDGRAVVTAIAATIGDRVGIFNVATVPEARGRGYGTAITAQAIREGLDSGARWSWLQSADRAVPLYERLGFRTLEHWPCWLAG